MREQNIEKLFKDSFSNFEADVNPSVWTNIEQGLPASPQNIPAKPSGFFGKIYLSTFVFMVAITAALIGTTVYFSSQKPQDAVAQIVQSEPQSTPQGHSAVHAAPVVSETTPAAAMNASGKESKNTAEKKTTRKTQEKVQQANVPQQTVTEKKEENKDVASTDPNTNSVQISAGEPVNAIAQNQENATSPGKISLNQVAENNHQDIAQSATPHTIETAPAWTLNHLKPADGTVPAEAEEQFHFFVPNVFTPNGDMLNDYFKPVNNLNVKNYEMTIFDRYGFEIFKSYDIDLPWDGKLRNGEVAAEAVYVYIIKLTDLNDEEHNYMGYVALFK